MAGTLNRAANPSKSETRSLAVVATKFKATWTAVLRDPSGGKGAIGGNTADITIYRGGSEKSTFSGDEEKMEEAGVVTTVDVYTPESSTSEKKVVENIEKKLSGQARGVCVDLVNIKGQKRGTILTMLKKKVQKAYVIAHADGTELDVFGTLPS